MINEETKKTLGAVLSLTYSSRVLTWMHSRPALHTRISYFSFPGGVLFGLTGTKKLNKTKNKNKKPKEFS